MALHKSIPLIKSYEGGPLGALDIDLTITHIHQRFGIKSNRSKLVRWFKLGRFSVRIPTGPITARKGGEIRQFVSSHAQCTCPGVWLVSGSFLNRVLNFAADMIKLDPAYSRFCYQRKPSIKCKDDMIHKYLTDEDWLNAACFWLNFTSVQCFSSSQKCLQSLRYIGLAYFLLQLIFTYFFSIFWEGRGGGRS